VACYRLARDGIVLAVRLTPRGGRDAIDGIVAGADGGELVAARVRAAPDKGAANAALVALLATALGRPKTAVRVVAGATARAKQVHVAGDVPSLARIVESWPRRSA
jgi:uncharacterized protein YggU (UPF0235/DUF167 family)